MIRVIVVAALAACHASPREEVLLHEDHVEDAYPRLSRDGAHILYQSNRTGTWQLYVLDVASRTSRQLTTGPANNNLPDWDADNRRIAFVSDRDGNEEIYLMDGDDVRRMTTHAGRDIHPYFTPDGTTLLFNSDAGGSFDVYAIDLATGAEREVTGTSDDETCARMAADGRSLVMLRNGGGGDDVWRYDLASGAWTNLTNTPAVRDGWPMLAGEWIYYSSMAAGSYSLYRMRRDGTGVQQLTHARPDEEDARAYVAADGDSLVFNRRHDGGIDIVRLRGL
jgi:TolB protein